MNPAHSKVNARMPGLFGASRRSLATTAHIVAICASLFSWRSAAATVVDWTFEEGAPGWKPHHILDQSSNGFHADEILGSPRISPGPDAVDVRALQLSPGQVLGSGFRVAERPQFRMTNEFTLEASFRPGSDSVSGANRTLIQRTDLTTFIWSYGLYFDPDQFQANFGIADASGLYVLIYAEVPRDGHFHRAAGTFQNGVLSLYVDGVLRTNLVTDLRPDPRPKLGVSVGAIWNGGYWFTGDISRVRISDRALKPPEFIPAPAPDPVFVADWDFEEGRQGERPARIHDASGNENDGVLAASDPGSKPLPAGQQSFVSTVLGDPGRLSLEIPAKSTTAPGGGFSTRPSASLSLHGDFSVEMLGRFSREANGGSKNVLVQFSPAIDLPSPSTNPPLALYFDGSSGQVGFRITVENGTSDVLEMPWPNDGCSHSILASRTGQELLLQLDGTLGTNRATTLVPNFGSVHSVAVGADPATGQGIVGVLDRIRIANRALSPTEWLPNPAHFEGVPVIWWQSYFGPAFTAMPSAHAAADPDNDGSSNEAEFKLGGNPLDPLSGFNATITDSGAIRWRSVPGITYRVFRQRFTGGEPVLISPSILAGSDLTVFPIPLGVAATEFYSVRASGQP